MNAKQLTSACWALCFRQFLRNLLLFAMLTASTAAFAQNNQGTNITVQLPTFGVSIDANGVLQTQTFEDPTGQLRAQRLQAAKAGLPGELAAFSKLRKVSLPRLERAIREQVTAGKSPDDTIRNLAGLQRLQYVFCYPDRSDIVIAGPAEGWLHDLAGRNVGLTTGQPVLALQDLLVALRAYPAGKRAQQFVGCTIDPPAEGLVRLQAFQKTIPHVIPQDRRGQVATEVARGIRDSLGMANIRVFGIPANTHFASVLIEADYRMKLIGIGLETPPIRLPSFLELSSSGKQGALERWWFTPNYDCMKVTDDRLGAELIGQGVQLLSEHKLVGPDGQLATAATSNKASDLFTQGFTSKYPQLAARSPVYAQLRQLIDLLVAAAYLQQEDFYGRAAWSPTTLADEKSLPVSQGQAATQVQAAVNVVWKGNRMLSPAGGGVSIRAEQALAADRLMRDEGGKLGDERQRVGQTLPADRWWWD